MSHATKTLVRSTIAVLVLAVLALGLGACSGGGGGKTEGTSNPPVNPPLQQGFQFEIMHGSTHEIVRVAIRNLASSEWTCDDLGLTNDGKTTHFTPMPDIGVYNIAYYWRPKGVPWAPETVQTAINTNGSLFFEIKDGETEYVLVN